MDPKTFESAMSQPAEAASSDAERFDPWGSAIRNLTNRPASLPDGGEVTEAKGWKVARISDPFKGVFNGYAFGYYGISSRASCSRHDDHVAPALGCECGFNAMKDRGEALRLVERWRGFVLLEVELFGRIIEHRLGWRAEEQDVLRVHVPVRCGKGFCRRVSTGLRQSRKRWSAACGAHLGADGVELSLLRRLGVDVVVTDLG